MKEKKKDRSFAIAVTASAIILAAVLFVMLAMPILSAKQKLRKNLSGFENAVASDAIEVLDPTYDGGVIPTDASAVLYEEEMLSLSRELVEATAGAKYEETRKVPAGSWDISVSLRTDGGAYTLYFDENEFYVSKGIKQYVFTPDKDSTERYSAFYEYVEKILELSASK